MRLRCTGRSRERGQGLVEMALVLPLFLILVVGIFDFGRAVAAHNSVSNAARTAVRVAIVNQDSDAVESAARDEAVGLSPLTVTFDYPEDTDGSCPRLGCIARVEVSYQWEPATPVIGQIIGPLTVSSASELAIEYVPAP